VVSLPRYQSTTLNSFERRWREEDDATPRKLGEVWKDPFNDKKPWRVQGFTARSNHPTKKAATAVGELFIQDQERRKEVERLIE